MQLHSGNFAPGFRPLANGVAGTGLPKRGKVLAELPEVVMAAAFGVPDDLAGEAVHALVVPLASSDLSEEQLLRFCRQRLPAYKVPKRIGMVDALPTNQYGKIARARLLDLFRSVQAADGP